MRTIHALSRRRRFSRGLARPDLHPLLLFVWLVLGAGAGLAQETFIAYVVPTNTPGNQTGLNAEPIGMDFDVANEIIVTRLGVFDAGLDGFVSGTVLTNRLWDRSQDPPVQLASIEFTSDNPIDLV